MTSFWSPKDLAQLTSSSGLHIAPLRDTGNSYGTPTWVWSVVVDRQLYVRPYHGQRSTWFQAAITQNAGLIIVARTPIDVEFSLADSHLQQSIDDAYRAKYHGSTYLPPMLGREPGSCTIKICRSTR